MANSSFFGYSYFSGANVFIKLNGIPALETAGITYSVQESTAPIYGYSSRIFDAVAMGQKIIRGSFVINFIAPNYIARIIELGRAGLDIENVEETFRKSDFSEELVPLQQKLKDAIEAQELIELQYMKAQEGLMEELNPSYRELAENRNSLQESISGRDDTNWNVTKDVFDIYEAHRARARDLGNLIGHDGTLYSAGKEDRLNFYVQEEELRQALGKNEELRDVRAKNVKDRYAKIEREYLQKALAAKNKIDQLEKLINDKRVDLDLDYEQVALSQGTSVVNLKKEIEQMRKDLEDENKSLVQREVASRTLLNSKLNQIKNSKNYTSVEQAINSMNALEKINTSYYSNSQEMEFYGVNNTNDIGLLGPFNIDIQFAEEYTIRIIDAFLTSRGSMIQIDENAIVEEYSFFARDIKYF